MTKNIFSHSYTVHFADTDAAGVVYFANVLRICHQAYEQSLLEFGFDLKTFFQNTSAAIPIIHAEVDFFRPLYCGDELLINVCPQLLNQKTFEINYQLSKDSTICCVAKTKHISINPATRKTQFLPEKIIKWIEN